MAQFENFYATKLEASASASDTTLQVKNIPVTITKGRLVLESRNPSKREIVSFDGIIGNILQNVVRGQQGTVATSHAAGVSVEQNPTAADFQDLYDAFNSFSSTNGSGWFLTTSAPTSIVYNGNHSYTMVFNGVNLTNVINPGTRIKASRNTPAPTRSTSLNGTTQYWVKASPNKMTFTDDFVISAWIKVSDYSVNCIASRTNGTSGFIFDVNASGQVGLFGYNGGSGNNSGVRSYQSIPLNKWVHVTAQLDMSSFSATPTTSYIMFDGVDVPAFVSRAGTNPTALVQAGNLEIGGLNGGADPFFGSIAQVAIFGAKVAQSTMQGYISQGLTGTETNVLSVYSFDGVATDLNTTTPNDLTAQASATATNADSPFGGQANGTISSTVEYGIVQSATFSTNTTLVIQTAEGNAFPTTGSMGVISYSGIKSPYGFTVKPAKWSIVFMTSGRGAGTSINNTFGAFGNSRLNVPIGAWVLEAQMPVTLLSSSSRQYLTALIALSSTTNTFAIPELTASLPVSQVSSGEQDGQINIRGSFETSTVQNIYTVAKTYGNDTVYIGTGVEAYSTIKAINAYL